MREDSPHRRHRSRSKAWTDVSDEGRRTTGVMGFVAASVGAHVLLSFALPAMAAMAPLDPWEPSELAFLELAPIPEPEPIAERESVQAPEPERAPEPVREPEPAREPDPVPPPEPVAEPEPVGTPDAVEEVADSVPEVPQATVASTEGGLQVGVPGGAG